MSWVDGARASLFGNNLIMPTFLVIFLIACCLVPMIMTSSFNWRSAGNSKGKRIWQGMVNSQVNAVNGTQARKCMFKALRSKALKHAAIVAFFINTFNFKKVVSSKLPKHFFRNFRLFDRIANKRLDFINVNLRRDCCNGSDSTNSTLESFGTSR